IGVFLPWTTLPASVSVGGGGGGGGKGLKLDLAVPGMPTSSSGIDVTAGIIQLVLSLGVAIFCGVALGLKNRMLFQISVYVAAGWGILGLLFRILTFLTLNSGIPEMMIQAGF